MNIQRISAFTEKGEGGNPAGVVLEETLPEPATMQAIAADLGYSETAFAAPSDDGFRVRYFAPEGEVPFCGHATIATGAALGAAFGAGRYDLSLNDGKIWVEAVQSEQGWGAQLSSPPTRHQPFNAEQRNALLALFGWTDTDLDPNLPIMRIHGGADHALIGLGSHNLLQNMHYNFDQGAALVQDLGVVTITLAWQESQTLIHARNPFAGHGVYEDPATGAAAAALAGYLRDSGKQANAFEILQGQDMGRPSRLRVQPGADIGSAIVISGDTMPLPEPTPSAAS